MLTKSGRGLLARIAKQTGACLSGVIVVALVVLGMLTAGLAGVREPLSDAQVRETIIRESIAGYQATGYPRACPYNLTRNGSSCGGRSAYSRLGGASPFCYPKDVSDGMIASWRRVHP